MTSQLRAVANGIILNNAYSWRRRQYMAQHPVPTPRERQERYEQRHARFTQDLWWFPSAMWEGCVKKSI